MKESSELNPTTWTTSKKYEECRTAISPGDRCRGLWDSVRLRCADGIRNKAYSTKYQLNYCIIQVSEFNFRFVFFFFFGEF